MYTNEIMPFSLLLAFMFGYIAVFFIGIFYGMMTNKKPPIEIVARRRHEVCPYCGYAHKEPKISL